MRFAVADPPYPGMAKKHYADHPDYGGEVDHEQLVANLAGFDGWVLHTSVPALREVWALCPEARLLFWGKSFAAWKRNVYPAHAFEPVLMMPLRNLYGDRQTPPDVIVEPMTLKRGTAGAKPARVMCWLFDCLGVLPTDELHDLFPGSGAVTAAWGLWCRQVPLAFPSVPDTDPLFEDAA